MRTISRTTQFKKDAKREYKTDPAIGSELQAILLRLALDQPLKAHEKDHKLNGNWKDHRECHIRPDLLLIYKKPRRELRLVRMGSHSELFQK